MSHLPRVLAVLPNYMASRNFLMTGVGGQIAERAKLTCILPAALHARLRQAGIAPTDALLEFPAPGSRLRDRISALSMWLWPGLGFGGLAFRFNEINGFAGHRFKLAFTAEQQLREASAGNFVAPRYGWPWPRSRTLYHILRTAYWCPWQLDHTMDALVADYRPDVVYIGQIQMAGTRNVILAAARRKIPIVGNVASWDQPTTKGPVPPRLDRYLVQSSWMKERLFVHHAVEADRIEITGWPQMDIYAEPVVPQRLQDYRERLGIPQKARIILFGLYSPRLGGHEPDAARALVAELEPDCHLLIRPHPRAMEFITAFEDLRRSPQVSFVTEGFDDLCQLRDQIRLASVVVSSFGSLALDAVALDRPAIYLSDGHVTPWASMEHLASVIETGAVPVAGSIAELMQLLERSLAEPESLAVNRAQLRALHLNPLDGEAGTRIAAAVLQTVGA